MRRAIALAVVAAVITMAAATPGWAHAGRNASQSLRSVLVSAPAGVSAKVEDDGTALTIAATRPTVVLGYAGEPFLRFEGGEVFENRNSPTVQDAESTSIVDGQELEPVDWQRIDGRTSYTWPDHRIVFSGSELPDEVMSSPEQTHVVTTWSIPLTVDGQAAVIEGRVDCVPTSESVALTVWLPIGLLVLALAVAAWAAFPKERRPRIRA